MDDDEEEEENQCNYVGVVDLMPAIRNTEKGKLAMYPKQEVVLPEGEEPETKGFKKGDPLGIFFNIATHIQKSCANMVVYHGLYKDAAYALTKSIDSISAKEAQGKIDMIDKKAKGEVSGVKKVMDQMLQISEKRKADDEAEAKEANDDDPGWSSEYRVMYNCYWSLLHQWREVNKAYNEEQASCERRRRKNLIRQMTIANDGIPPEEHEVQERMASGATDVFSGGMVATRSADEDFAAEFLEEAKEKQKAIQEIMEKAQELKELWDQFQLLLQRQGELLNQIGANLEKCKDFVKKANEDLDSAIEHQTAAQRKQLMMIAVCLCMLAIILFPILM